MNNHVAEPHGHLNSVYFQAKRHKTDVSLNICAEVCGKIIHLDYFVEKRKIFCVKDVHQELMIQKLNQN